MGALTRRAFELTDVPWDQCHHEDRGKLALVLVPSGLVLEKLPTTMAQAAREAARIRLRVSVHPQAGELTGSTVDRAFRLLEDSRFVDLVTEAVNGGVVAPADAFAEAPAVTVVHRLTEARVFLLTRSPAAMDSAAETYLLMPFPDEPGPFAGCTAEREATPLTVGRVEEARVPGSREGVPAPGMRALPDTSSPVAIVPTLDHSAPQAHRDRTGWA